MIRTTAFAGAFLCLLASCGLSPALAGGLHPRCNIDWPCVTAVFKSAQKSDLVARAARQPDRMLISSSSFEAAKLNMTHAERRQARRIARADRFRNVEFGSPMYPPETARSFLRHGAQILPHPSGCPSRAFCGCGAAVEVFGRPVRSLWLAANWLRFPRTSPAPGMVAAREEDVGFQKTTPSGSAEFVIDNPKATEQLVIGEYYYVDFHPLPKPEAKAA